MSLHLVSLFVLLLVGLGLWHRRMPARHIRFMSVAFAVDVALVLYIEGTRHAVETVVSTPRPLVWVHAAISLAVLALYVAQLSLGRRLLAGRPASRQVHIALGLTFVVMRGLNFATAFAVTAPAVPPATARLEIGPAPTVLGPIAVPSDVPPVRP